MRFLTQAEYLPLSVVPPTSDSTLLSEFLSSLLPPGVERDNITTASLTSDQWADLLDVDDEVHHTEVDDGLWTYGYEGSEPQKGDWMGGPEQERRSAYLIARVMQGERLLL